MITGVNFSGVNSVNRNNNRSHNPNFGAGCGDLGKKSAKIIASLPPKHFSKMLTLSRIPVNIEEAGLLLKKKKFARKLFLSTVDVTQEYKEGATNIPENLISKTIKVIKTKESAVFTYPDGKPQLKIYDAEGKEAKSLLVNLKNQVLRKFQKQN